MLSFLQHSRGPPQPCLDAAIHISQLINTYREIYGLDKCFSKLPRCLTFAAIVHVLSLDTSSIAISKDIRSMELHLAQAIRALHEMKADRCLTIVRDLIENWGVTVPAPVRIMLNEIQLESTIGGLNNGHEYTNGIMDETDGSTNNAYDENENESDDDAPSMTNSLDMAFDESWMNF